MFDIVWYDNLTKPFLNPPAWVFPPVWIILYCTLLIALLFYTVSISEKKKIKGYLIFIVHMIFNILWSPVFFALHRIGMALAIVILMDITAIYMIKKFYAVSKISGLILLPYLCWILFATYLNLQFLVLN